MSRSFYQNEKESCINNVKLNLNLTSTSTKEYCRSSGKPTTKSHRIKIDKNTYTKATRGKQHIRASLDNVSCNPWRDGQFEDDQSSLRRTRSLAISRENLFYSLNYSEQSSQVRQRRSQLIPRAKLIDKSSLREQKFDSLPYNTKPLSSVKRNSLEDTTPDYSPVQERRQSSNYQQRSSTSTTKSEEKSEKVQIEEEFYTNVSVHPPVHIPSYKPSSDSLDSNFYNKSSLNNSPSPYRVSLEDLPGLSLPNYYPGSENTDNVSLTDNVSSISLDNISKHKFSSCDNICTLDWLERDVDSIPYDENIILKKTESHYAKPKTIRGPTPYYNYNYGKEKNCNPQKVAERNVTPPQTDDSTTQQEPSLEFETNTNFDEIKHINENITKTVVQEDQEEDQELPDKSKSNTVTTYSNIEANPLYEECERTIVVNDITEQVETQNTKTTSETSTRTLIEVSGDYNNNSDDQYKTIVEVDTTCEKSENSDQESSKSTKAHSHNYLKEFLESQKGSTKPLQNFIAKKFSNLTRRNSKDSESGNLSSNQFHSLPDITASKNLRKSEKIDRKLRKCQKNSFLIGSSKNVSESVRTCNENRFIVNIGRHFDITAQSSVPIDFEVKIAKINKKNSGRRHLSKSKSDQTLLDAVKNLKDTIHRTDSSTNLEKSDIKLQVITPVTKNLYHSEGDLKDKTMDPEYQEKLGTMRNYWNKMLGNGKKNTDAETKNDESNTKCKVIDVTTKIDEVKKKFEPKSDQADQEEKSQSKVQLTKQMFEPKIIPEKPEKISPVIKETFNYFENNENNQYESLCPSSVEIIGQRDHHPEKVNIKPQKSAQNPKLHKPILKSKSICNPDFDHVRYRVVKSDLFQKKIFANCEKESQFDGLMQYLQDYSFQELLIDNNIVIIEPIRTKISYEPSRNGNRSTKNVTPMLLAKDNDPHDDNGGAINRHFFYHPIRVNKEVNDDELPNPDTVRQARQFFEGRLKRSLSSEHISKEKYSTSKDMVDPDKDRCSATTETNSNGFSSNSDFGSHEDIYDSIDNEICCEYVSEDILEKIRERGTTVTYYGGKVVDQQFCQPTLLKAIMEEIKSNEKRCKECRNCRKNSIEGNRITQSNISNSENGRDNSYQGIKFRLVKSNSCNSRLELVGTEQSKKFISKHKHLLANNNSHNKGKKRRSFDNTINNKDVNSNNNSIFKKEVKELHEVKDKNVINENIKKQILENEQNQNNHQPKIIGEEKKLHEIRENNKLVQWGEVKNEKAYATITFKDKKPQKINEYQDFEKVKTSRKSNDDIEFESYEVAQ